MGKGRRNLEERKEGKLWLECEKKGRKKKERSLFFHILTNITVLCYFNSNHSNKVRLYLMVVFILFYSLVVTDNEYFSCTSHACFFF